MDKILRSTVVNSGWDLKRQRLHAPDDYDKGKMGETHRLKGTCHACGKHFYSLSVPFVYLLNTEALN